MLNTIKRVITGVKDTIVSWAKGLWNIVKQHKSALIGF